MEKVLREIVLEGCFNFRELGGYETSDGRRVKSGVLFRSGNLSRLTESDKEALKGLGIKHIVDLRDDDEIEKHPDPAIDGAKWHHIPLIKDEKVVRQAGDLNQFESKLVGSKPGEMLISLNRGLVANTAGFAEVFKILLMDPDKPLLFHCMAGKDRTGAVAALLLSALGIPQSVIEADYMYTNNSLKEMERGFAEIGYSMPDFIDIDVVRAIYEARLEYIRAFYDEIEKNFGSIDVYLSEGLGLSANDLSTLRSRLLDS